MGTGANTELLGSYSYLPKCSDTPSETIIASQREIFYHDLPNSRENNMHCQMECRTWRGWFEAASSILIGQEVSSKLLHNTAIRGRLRQIHWGKGGGNRGKTFVWMLSGIST